MNSKNGKYQPNGGHGSVKGTLDFVVRPRFGNNFPMPQAGSGGKVSVSLSSMFTKIAQPELQAEAVAQLGIHPVSKYRTKVHLQEYPQATPRDRYPSDSGTAASESRVAQPAAAAGSCMELSDSFISQNPVQQPFDIRVSYANEAYIEADTAFCCLLEFVSPYGEKYSIPVPGRGSFSYLGNSAEKSMTRSLQWDHCLSGTSAGFLQRAALTMGVLLCLCELSSEDDKKVVKFYHEVDRAYGYGLGPYLDYIVYCCQTTTQQRDSFLKFLCLEWNNSFTKKLMTEALTHFIKTREPTHAFYKEVQSVMSQKELEQDREFHFSVRGKAVKAAMHLKNAARQRLTCCTCHFL